MLGALMGRWVGRASKALRASSSELAQEVGIVGLVGPEGEDDGVKRGEFVAEVRREILELSGR